MTGAKYVTTVFSKTFTDPGLAGGTIIKAVHFTDLRAAINTLRSRYAGLGAFTWTDSTLTVHSSPVKRVHLTDLRTALNQAYTAAGRTTPSYTDPTPVVGQTLIKATHVNELRTAVQSLE
jgi:hypothetical protein